MARNILVVIPARGGSKGIPRKNLRTLHGRPLLAYAIELARQSRFQPDVYVSSEDAEILALARRLGVSVHERDATASDDATPLDPVVYSAWKTIRDSSRTRYDLIVTLQPTSPLLRPRSLDGAIEFMLSNPEIDTLISAADATHLTWRQDGDRVVKNYEKRLNRQELPRTFRETGGLLITRESTIESGTRVGSSVALFPLSGAEAIDIDTYEDWSVCEYYLAHKRILFVLTGNRQTGLGHVYNSLAVAHDIMEHRICFLVEAGSELAHQRLSLLNYELHRQRSEDLVSDILALSPDVVINDRLDTSIDYVRQLKDAGVAVINFEDLGEGASVADLVVNATYPESQVFPNHYHGPRFFCARDEFVMAPTKRITEEVRNVLITFGGVDPNDYTRKVLESIYDDCERRHVHIDVVAGFGYCGEEGLREFGKVALHRNVASMSEFMLKADVVFTSAGRTAYEIACLGTPAIVLAQNARETSHFFAREEFGFRYLGLGVDCSVAEIRSVFHDVASNARVRRDMNRRMLAHDIRAGRGRVVRLIRDLIREVGEAQ